MTIDHPPATIPAALAPEPVTELVRRLGGTVVASFPRSGSTLTRKLVTSVIRASVPGLEDISWREGVPNFLPDHHILADMVGRCPIVARSHDPQHIPDNKTLFLFRRPEDALFSFHRLSLKKGRAVALDRHALRHMPAWRTIAEVAIRKRRDTPEGIHFLSYERYVADPIGEAQAALDFIGFARETYSAAIIADFDAAFRRDRPERGLIGSGAGQFPDAVTRRIDRDLMPLYRELASYGQGAG